MIKRESLVKGVLFLVMASIITGSVYADASLDSLMKSKEYQKAIDYATKKLPTAKRSVDEWIVIATALEMLKSPVDKIVAAYNGAQKANPSDPRVYLGFAKVNYSQKKYPEALKAYQRAYILQRTAEAAEGITITAFRLKQYDKARDAGESAVHLNAGVIESRKILVQIYLKNKEYGLAASQLEVLVKNDEKNLKYWQKLVLCYEKLNKPEKLAVVDPKLIALDKKNITSRVRHAEWAIKNKETDLAFSLYKELAILTPNKKSVFENLYKISSSKGQKKDATLYLKNYLALDSVNVEYNKELANLLFGQKQMDEALVYFKRTASLAPKTKGIYKNYAEITIGKNLDKETIQVVNAAKVIKEADARMLIALADIYKKNKQCPNAIVNYQLALKTDVKNMDVMRSLAKCQATSGKVTDAVITYEQIVMLDPNSVVEHKALGNLNSRLKKNDQSIKAYKTYLKKKPSDGKVAIIVGLDAYGKKKYKEAIQYLTMAKDAKLHNKKYLESLGLAYFNNKDYANAVKYLAKLKEKSPSVTIQKNTYKQLAESYEQIGKKKEAASIFAAYTSIKGVVDKDASYKQAFLIEGTDKAKAITMYSSNIKRFTKDFRNFLRLGIIYSEDKTKLKAASDMLKQASLLNSKDAEILRKLGRVYGHLKHKNSELAIYKKLLALIPDDQEANKRVGTLLIAQKNYSAGITNLEIVYTKEVKNVEIILLLAEGYMKTKRPQKAVTLLTKAKSLKGDDVKIRLDLIAAAEAAAKKDVVATEKASLAELDKTIISKDKKDISSRVRLADYSYENKDYKTAFPIYKELAVLTPKEKVVFNRLFEISMKNGDKKGAAGYLKTFLQLDPKNAKAHMALGNLLFELKDADGALNAYRTASKLDPALKGFYLNYAKIVVMKKLSDEAITVLKKAIVNKENDKKTHLVLADIYKSKKMYKSAIPMYTKASQNDPKNVSILISLGECQVKTAQISSAVVTYEQAVMMDPKSIEAHKALGELKTKQGKTADAIKAYKKYLELKKTDSKVAEIVGKYEYGKKNYKEAIKFYELVTDAKIRDAYYFLNLGLSYFNEKNYQKAVLNFELLNKRKISDKTKVKFLKELGESYEQLKKNMEAADAYAAYTKIPGVRDGDASYKKAFLREGKDKNTAITMYTSNTKIFTQDHRNFLRLGMIFSDDKTKYTTSANMLSKASALQPKDAKILETLAKVYGKAKNSTNELSTYKKFLALEPANLEANRRVGVILSMKKMYKESILNLEMVVTQKPKDIEVLLLLAKGYSATKQPAKAVKYLEKAAAIKADDTQIVSDQYDIYKEIGKAAEAETAVKKLIALTKENKWRIVYAKDLLAAKRVDEAVKVITDIISADPSSLDGLMLRGKAQQIQGKYADATETYKMISFINDSHLPMLYERGNVYLAEKKYSRAESYYNKVTAKDAKSALGYVGLAKVAKAQGKTALFNKHIAKAKALEPNNPEVKDAAK